MTWTPEMKQKVFEAYDKGMSDAQIARDVLGGAKTRAAVIGIRTRNPDKMKRMGCLNMQPAFRRRTAGELRFEIERLKRGVGIPKGARKDIPSAIRGLEAALANTT